MSCSLAWIAVNLVHGRSQRPQCESLVYCSCCHVVVTVHTGQGKHAVSEGPRRQAVVAKGHAHQKPTYGCRVGAERGHSSVCDCVDCSVACQCSILPGRGKRRTYSIASEGFPHHQGPTSSRSEDYLVTALATPAVRILRHFVSIWRAPNGRGKVSTVRVIPYSLFQLARSPRCVIISRYTSMSSDPVWTHMYDLVARESWSSSSLSSSLSCRVQD